MPERKYEASATSSYRYGFNGKEKSDEVSGDGNAYDFGARIQDPRLGRWLSVDPLQQKYTDLSPYQYCANSPIAAKDPDGRLIIFINGLWGGPNKVGKGGTEDYWNKSWVQQVQDKIGDHADPRYYDGSMGGFSSSVSLQNIFVWQRIKAGKDAGYNDASSIIGKLSDGETIKIVTNSMGTAFARGFTKGILKYQAEQNAIRQAFNDDIDAQIKILKDNNNVLSKGHDNVPIPQTTTNNEEVNKKIETNKYFINYLETKKQKLLDVRFEMEVDLSSHQVDYPNGDVENNYYMSCDPENMHREGTIGMVEQKDIIQAKYIGTMKGHHSSGADPQSMPRSSTPDPVPHP